MSTLAKRRMVIDRQRRCYGRCNKGMATKIGLGRCFTVTRLVVVFIVATLMLSSTMVSSKSPSLIPRHRRGPGAGSSSRKMNNNALVSTSASSTKSQEAAWISGFKNGLASGLAAGCSKLLLAPFDTIKTIQQAAFNSGKAPLSLSKAAQEILKRPKGFLEFYVSTHWLKTSQNFQIVRYISYSTICVG
jgi:hypothetical protein